MYFFLEFHKSPHIGMFPHPVITKMFPLGILKAKSHTFCPESCEALEISKFLWLFSLQNKEQVCRYIYMYLLCMFFLYTHVYYISWAMGIRKASEASTNHWVDIVHHFSSRASLVYYLRKVHSSNTTNIAIVGRKTWFLIEISAVCHLTFASGVVFLPQIQKFPLDIESCHA